MNNTNTPTSIDDLMYSPEYAEYIMKFGDRPCSNGDMLLELMEDGYLFKEFVMTLSSLCAVHACREAGILDDITGVTCDF